MEFSARKEEGANDAQRYEHISRVLTRLDYTQCGKRERWVWCWPTGATPAAKAVRRSRAW